MAVILEKPTVDVVKAVGKKFDEENKIFEDALAGLFEHYPTNTNTSDVLLKVLTLNALYSTQIPPYSNRIPTIWEVIDHIVKLDIDVALSQGDENIVEKIADVNVINKHQRNYSFATKYCNWHRPELFPIYDSHVDICLWQMRIDGWVGGFDRQDMYCSYPKFKKIVTIFQDSFLPEKLTYKEIDKYLYYEGGKLLEAIEMKKHAASITESPQSLSASNADEKTKP